MRGIDDLKDTSRQEAATTNPVGPQDEITLAAVFALLWRGRFWIAGFAFAFGALAVLHVYITEPVYRSAILVTVRQDELSGSLGALRGQLGGLASLAGIMPGGGSSHRQEFVAYLKSRALAKEFVERQRLMHEFYPSNWNAVTKTFEAGSRDRPPTAGDAVDLLFNIRQIQEEARTGLITVSFDWTDRELAAKWANEYVALANEKLRQEAIASANQSIAYLTEELARTTLEPVRQSLYSIMEGRLNQAMYASVEPEFAFKAIDRAEPSEPDKYVRPRRALELLFGIAFGVILGMAFVFWRYSRAHSQLHVTRTTRSDG